jgi:uncharacterized transporter YbjL
MSEENSYLANVAFGCLIAIVSGLVLTRANINPDNGIYVWLLFVVCIGLAFSADIKSEETKVGQGALIISAAMLLTLTFKGALQWIFAGVMVNVASIGPMSPESLKHQDILAKYCVFYVIIFLFTIPAIIAAIYARNILLFFTRKLINTDISKFEKIEKLINYTIKIIALIIGTVFALK